MRNMKYLILLMIIVLSTNSTAYSNENLYEINVPNIKTLLTIDNNSYTKEDIIYNLDIYNCLNTSIKVVETTHT